MSRGRWTRRYMAVKAVALNRFTPSFPDCMFEGCDGLLLRSRRTRHVENFFLDDSAVQIVYAVTERDLSQRQSHAHPISGKMLDVVQVNAADGKIAKLLKRGSWLYVREHGGLRFESKGNEPGKTAGLVLQLAQLAQMIDALGQRFNVSVEHGARAAAAHLMPRPMDVEPFLGGFFPAANLVPHSGIENFRAAARD